MLNQDTMQRFFSLKISGLSVTQFWGENDKIRKRDNQYH